MATKEINYAGINYNISYEIINPNSKAYILVLHGWGANKELMIKAFGAKFASLRQVYIDLPGFGASSIERPLMTRDYAAIVREFIGTMKEDPLAIMGHSFGGKVATLLNPKNLILLSSAGILEPKRLKVRIKIAIFKFIKHLGFGRFYHYFATDDVLGMSRTMYETLKNVVNEDFSKEFASVNSKNSLIFWGKEDKAVSLASGEKIHRIIKNSKFYPLGGDHFFFLLHSEFIAKTIEETLFNINFEESQEGEILTESKENR